MKNSEIIQMLLEDGESTAVPNLSKENARSLAQRHGNCGEKKPKPLGDSNKFYYTELKKEVTEKELELSAGKLKNSDEKEIVSNANGLGQPKCFPFSMECYETLVDSILACQAHYSLSIGLFFKYANYFKNQNIMIIKDLFTKKSEETYVKEDKLKITPFLVTLIILSSILFGYLLALIISWEVGLSVGFTILFVMLIGLGLIFVGSYSQEWKMALQAGQIVKGTLESLKLLLKVIFINPLHSNNFQSDQLSIIFTHLVISNYSNNYHAVATFIENIWSAVEKDYSNFCIRFLKASLNKEYGEKRFKRICCLPTFMYFIISIFCILGIGTILKVNESNISIVFINKLTLIAFSFLAIILILSLIGLVYLFLKMICCVIHAPTHNLKGFLKSYNAYGEASTQAFLISEFKCVLNFLAQVDQYRNDKRSIIVSFIDATGAIDLKILTEFCSFCQILLKNRNEIPLCMIILADNQLYTIADSAENMVEFFNFTKLLSLSLYLDNSPSTMLMMESGSIERNGIDETDNANNTISSKKSKTSENIQYMGINKHCNGFKTDLIIHKLYKNPYNPKEDLLMDGLSAKNVSDYLIIKSKLSDFNVPCIRDLVIIVTYAYKVSKVQTISTDLFKLIDLVTLYYHWPFIYTWISIFVSNNLTKIKKSMTIRKLFDTFLRNMLHALVEEPVILVLSKLDLSHDIMENIINENDIGELTIDEFMILNAACHLKNLPMQKFIKGALKRSQIEKSKTVELFYDGLSDQSYSSKNKFMTIQSQTIKSGDTLPDYEKEKMTPKSFRKCLQYVKELFSSLILSEMTIEDVVWMLGQIKEISQENVAKYQEKIKEININGLVLATCDPIELRTELQMSFGDWHLFKTLINYLKSIEETNESTILNDISEPTTLTKPSPYNPLSLLEKSELIVASPPLDNLESCNSNEAVLSDDTPCKLCENRLITNSDTDSVWKRKTPPYAVNISKDHFLSPVTVSSISSPKLQPDSNNNNNNNTNNNVQQQTNRAYLDHPSDLADFYSIKESAVNESYEADPFIQRTKSLPREASFESTTTFSTQLSSPRNSKCLYDVDTKTKIYTLPNKKRESSIIKIKHNIGCQSYSQLQGDGMDQNEDLDFSIDDNSGFGNSAGSKFQSYLKKTEKLYHSSLFDIDKGHYSNNAGNTGTIHRDKGIKQSPFETRKYYSQTNMRTQNKTKRRSSKPDKSQTNPKKGSNRTSHIFVKPNIPNMCYVENNEPDIIFRSKSYTNGHEFLSNVNNSAAINNNSNPLSIYHIKQHRKKEDKSGRDKPNSRDKSKRPRHKGSYAEALNNEISNSEI